MLSRVILSGVGTLLSLLAITLLAVYTLAFTEPGARWLLEQALARVPALQVGEVRGTLASRLTFERLSWQDRDNRAEIGTLSLQGDPQCLWRATLCLTEVAATQIRGRSATGDDAGAGPLQLPAFLWPIRVEFHAVSVQDLQWQVGNAPDAGVHHVDAVRFRAVARGRRVALKSLSIALPGRQVTGEITLRTTATWSLQSKLEMQSDTPAALRDWLPDERLQLLLTTKGPLDALACEADLGGSLPVRASATLDLLAEELALEGALNVPAWTFSSGDISATLRELQATVAGKVSDLQFEAGGRLLRLQVPDAPRVPAGELTAKGRWAGGALPELAFSYLAADGAHALRWQGSVQPAGEETQITGNLHVRSDRLSDWVTGLDGQLRARSPLQVQLRGGETRTRLEMARIEGEARGEVFTLGATVDAQAGADGVHVVLEQAGGAVGPARFTAQGAVFPRIGIDGQVEITRLAALHADARGAARSSFRLVGEPTSPGLSFSADFREPGWQAYGAGSLQATGIVSLGARPTLEIRATGSRLAGLPEQLPLENAALRVDGDLAQLRIALDADGPESLLRLATTVSRDGQDTDILIGEGALQAPLAGAWRLAAPAALRWSPAAGSLLIRDDTCLSGVATLCVLAESRMFAAGDVTRLRMQDIGESLWREHLPAGLSIHAELAGEGDVSWSSSVPTVQLTLHGETGYIALAGTADLPAMKHPFEQVVFQGTVDAEATRTRLRLQSAALGQVNAQLQLARSDEALAGNLRIEGLQFAPLRPLFPGVDALAGQLDADIDIGGSRSLPVLNGSIRVSDTHARGAALPLELHDLHMDADLAGEQLVFRGRFNTREESSGDSAKSLAGAARFDGDARWAGSGRELNLRVEGNELQVQVGGQTALVLDASLVAQVTPELLDAKGEARIREGRIRLPRQGADAVWLADDVILVPAPPPKPAARPLPFATVRTALSLDLGDRLSFSGHGIDGWLGGSLQITDLHKPRPRGRGTIEIREGRYRAYGQRLVLRRGKLRFRGDLFDPSLDVEAIRPLDQMVAGVRVKGLASAPEVRLFSEPSMPEEEILSWLILGKPLGGGSAQDSQMLSAALLSYSLRTGEEQGTKLAERLGIQQFEVGTSDVDGNAGVFASGYLSPRLFIRYGVSGAEAANSLTLRYRVLPKLFLEASSGLQTAVDLLYSFSF